MREDTKARDRAILWTRAVLETDFIILDTETTGLNNSGESGDEVIGLGVIGKEGQVLLDTLICHTKLSNEKALALHGHSWEATRLAPTWAEVLPKLKEVVAGKVIISYCVNDFDALMILSTCRVNKTELLDLRPQTMLVLELFAEFYGERSRHQSYRWQKLSVAAGHFGIDTAGAHGAVADCQMTLGVLRGMAEAKLKVENSIKNRKDL